MEREILLETLCIFTLSCDKALYLFTVCNSSFFSVIIGVERTMSDLLRVDVRT